MDRDSKRETNLVPHFSLSLLISSLLFSSLTPCLLSLYLTLYLSYSVPLSLLLCLCPFPSHCLSLYPSFTMPFSYFVSLLLSISIPSLIASLSLPLHITILNGLSCSMSPSYAIILSLVSFLSHTLPLTDSRCQLIK